MLFSYSNDYTNCWVSSSVDRIDAIGAVTLADVSNTGGQTGPSLSLGVGAGGHAPVGVEWVPFTAVQSPRPMPDRLVSRVSQTRSIFTEPYRVLPVAGETLIKLVAIRRPDALTGACRNPHPLHFVHLFAVNSTSVVPPVVVTAGHGCVRV